eukprot:755667-Pyramimonas_sp.AAC.1
MPTSFNNLRKTNDFGLFGPSWQTSWRHLGPSWGPIGRFLGRLGPLWAILAGLEASRDPLGGHLGPSWPFCRPSRPSWRDL